MLVYAQNTFPKTLAARRYLLHIKLIDYIDKIDTSRILALFTSCPLCIMLKVINRQDRHDDGRFAEIFLFFILL